MDLVEFLLARLAEDEQVAKGAKAADGEHWSFRVSPYTGDRWDTEIVEYLGQAEGSGVRYIEVTAQHITRHDPARVLAEVEAKRQIIDLHRHRPEQAWDGSTLTGDCAECGDEHFPCPTLRALALPYADHPECHPSWLPAVREQAER